MILTVDVITVDGVRQPDCNRGYVMLKDFGDTMTIQVCDEIQELLNPTVVEVEEEM